MRTRLPSRESRRFLRQLVVDLCRRYEPDQVLRLVDRRAPERRAQLVRVILRQR